MLHYSIFWASFETGEHTMKRILKLLVVSVLSVTLSLPGLAQDTAQPTITIGTEGATKTVDWREEYAYGLGIHAYVIGFPWIYLPTLRWLWVTQPRDPERTPYAPLNQFWHSRKLTDASYRDGGSPNNDTLYSIAWLDLAKEPMILSVPDTGERYRTMQMASLDGDNFAYVGTRTTGGQAGHYAIIGPHWKGTLPDKVQALEPSRTNAVLIFGRTLVDGPADLPAVHAIQDQYKLTPLSQWGNENFQPVNDRDVWPPGSQDDPLGEWKTMNRAMTEDPPVGDQAVLMSAFWGIGVGPGMDVDKMDAATKRGLARAAVTGKELLKASIKAVYGGEKINGWRFTSKTYGRAGLAGEYLNRAGPQCLAGIIGNEPEEAMYISAFEDSKGETLDGNNNYRIHFAPGSLPPVKSFWSMTIYGTDYNLVDNPIDRYALGDRSTLKRDADGGITLYLQSESPGPELESNWLPTPKDTFYVTLRNYIPEPALLERQWQPPAVVRVD
jgi:hypothetical protein